MSGSFRFFPEKYSLFEDECSKVCPRYLFHPRPYEEIWHVHTIAESVEDTRNRSTSSKFISYTSANCLFLRDKINCRHVQSG